MTVPRLHPDDLSLLADLIVERLRAAPVAEAPARELVDANEAARLLGTSPRWCRDHAEQLEAVRLGDGERPRLRFPLAVVERIAAERQEVTTLEAPRGSATAETLPLSEFPVLRRRRRSFSGTER